MLKVGRECISCDVLEQPLLLLPERPILHMSVGVEAIYTGNYTEEAAQTGMDAARTGVKDNLRGCLDMGPHWRS